MPCPGHQTCAGCGKEQPCGCGHKPDDFLRLNSRPLSPIDPNILFNPDMFRVKSKADERRVRDLERRFEVNKMQALLCHARALSGSPGPCLVLGGKILSATEAEITMMEFHIQAMQSISLELEKLDKIP